jgi:hypothetical protein
MRSAGNKHFIKVTNLLLNVEESCFPSFGFFPLNFAIITSIRFIQAIKNYAFCMQHILQGDKIFVFPAWVI